MYIDCKEIIGQKGVKFKKIKTVDYQQFLTFFCSLNKEIRYRTMAGFQFLQLRRCVTQTDSRIRLLDLPHWDFGFMVRNSKDCYRLLELFILLVQYVTCINKLSDQNSRGALKCLPFWVNGKAKKKKNKNQKNHANRMKRARLLAKTTIDGV